ncbi:unnamed protein product [Caretta caretta]
MFLASWASAVNINLCKKICERHVHYIQRGKLQVTMQSSSAQVTMMESQNRKRAPAWTEQEGMKDRGHNRDPKQCRVKLKELRQAYQKTREANGHSGRRRDLHCMCFNDHRIFSFPEASED